MIITCFESVPFATSLHFLRKLQDLSLKYSVDHRCVSSLVLSALIEDIEQVVTNEFSTTFPPAVCRLFFWKFI